MYKYFRFSIKSTSLRDTFVSRSVSYTTLTSTLLQIILLFLSLRYIQIQYPPCPPPAHSHSLPPTTQGRKMDFPNGRVSGHHGHPPSHHMTAHAHAHAHGHHHHHHYSSHLPDLLRFHQPPPPMVNIHVRLLVRCSGPLYPRDVPTPCTCRLP